MRSYIHVRFDNGAKSYVYTADGSVADNDKFTHAVVETQTNGYVVTTIVNVTELIENSFNGKTKPVVHLFNDAVYKDKLKREARKQSLEIELKRRAEELSSIHMLEKLLSDDEQSKALLAEYKSL